jgi:hypothetical protein
LSINSEDPQDRKALRAPVGLLAFHPPKDAVVILPEDMTAQEQTRPSSLATFFHINLH